MTRKNIDWNNEVIPKAIPIINEQCEKIGGPVTVRRIFYILLSMGLIDDKKYGYLSDKLARTREKGALDWDTIHDESRGIYAIMRNPAGCVLPDPDDYMLDPTPNIDTYTEVWVEKAGNVPILWPVCAKYCI
ncbi:MAG: hypothetical protein ACE5IO_08180, partial [Thermoplasmata archaeon]